MDWLDYHHLRYFWTVAREGSVKKPAEKLHVSQPSISEQIRKLEESLGEKLFRREGRSNVLTDAGRILFSNAEDIFPLGQELVNAIKQRSTAKSLRLCVGVADSFPKLVTSEILKRVFALPQAVHLIFREGKMEDLLAQLAAHRLEIVLADEQTSSSTNFKTFNHPLGEMTATFCAAKSLACRLEKAFPQSLDDAPARLPAENTALRRSLETWFRDLNIRPHLVAEFEDLALMKVMAAEGHGFIALPPLAAAEAVSRYQFQVIGTADKCRVPFHAITAQRRITHPGVVAITEKAAQQ